MPKLSDFIHISPGFKAAVNLKNDRNNLDKVAGFIPTDVAREIILDLAKKLHPASDLRSRIIMGTYGTGKSHLALVLLNFFEHALTTPQLQTVMDKLEPDTQTVLKQYRDQVPQKFLIVNLYGNEGEIADSLMMGLRHALELEGLEGLLPTSAFDAAISRINDIEKNYPEGFTLLKAEVEGSGMTVDELKTRLQEYQKKAFDKFRQIHPRFSAGGEFAYTTILSPNEFYRSIVKELKEKHGINGIAIFWDEFGNKMEEVVKDPTGKEGLALQEFAECCNASENNQLHLYLFCHRSLKEYHDISMHSLGTNNQHLEEDLRKIEGRFKQYIMKSTDVETFQLIDGVIVADESKDGWQKLTTQYNAYFETLVQETVKLKYFTGFNAEELKSTVVLGTYPLHPMSVYSLPAISEKVAQNNRTLFTCLCEDEPGSFKRFLDKVIYDSTAPIPPMFTVDGLWDYFADDVKQQERTHSIYRDFEHLKTRLEANDQLGLRILKAISVFRVTNSARVKLTEPFLVYALNIPAAERQLFGEELARHSDLQNENHILMKLQADGSYRPAVSSSTESLVGKVRKLLKETPEKLGQSPVRYLKSLWNRLSVGESYDATGYGDDFGVVRKLWIEPISFNQLQDSLHILTKNLGTGTYQDGIILVPLCANSSEVIEARNIAAGELADKKYQQAAIAIPKEPVQIFNLLKEHQALSYLKDKEASLYGEGGELYEEWSIWESDKAAQIIDTVSDLFTPEKQLLDYFWQGNVQQVQNNRQIKKLASTSMYSVFPDCPIIGEPKLALDEFGGNWGYRAICRDIIQKLTDKDAAEKLWNETAAQPKHIISQLFKTNGLLRKNQAGDCVIEKPAADTFNGANKTWECIEKYLKKARTQPVQMENLVRTLRKPPFGVKCRVMPLLFAAAAHKELVLGNISFEFKRNAQQTEKITSIESDTLEKVFTTPEKYKLIYVNVSSNQTALINGLAKLYDVELSPSDPPLERVKKVGNSIGSWWRALPKYAQNTRQLSEAADVLREYVFRPLAALEVDTAQILLKDVFEYVFDADKKVQQKRVVEVTGPIIAEFEGLLDKLKKRIVSEYKSVFADFPDPCHSVSMWFENLTSEKKTYIYNGEQANLVNICREGSTIDEDILLTLAERFTGIPIASWSDEQVVKFGAKLDSAKNFIDTFNPPSPPSIKPEPNIKPDSAPTPGQGKLTGFFEGRILERTFELPAELSSNGDVLENMLNSTIEQLGKGLNEKEKIAIIYRIVGKHVFGA